MLPLASQQSVSSRASQVSSLPLAQFLFFQGLHLQTRKSKSWNSFLSLQSGPQQSTICPIRYFPRKPPDLEALAPLQQSAEAPWISATLVMSPRGFCRLLLSLASSERHSLHAASFGVGYNNGGPVSIVWGWVLVSIMSLSVAACMAEITSSLPISGGPYYWCVPSIPLLAVSYKSCDVTSHCTLSFRFHAGTVGTQQRRQFGKFLWHLHACVFSMCVRVFQCTVPSPIVKTSPIAEGKVRNNSDVHCRSVELTKGTKLSSAFAGWFTGTHTPT